MQDSADITAIILAFNEELHLERCVRSLQAFCRRIVVIDSFSTDATVKIARASGAEVVQHAFSNQANQFQWGLDNLAIDTGWVMRVDADEYVEPELSAEICGELPGLPADIDGIYLKRKVYFMGKWIRHGGFYPHVLLRIWRTGTGRMEQRLVDEHMVLPPTSRTIQFKEHLVDDNHKGITFWTDKHNNYASREMSEILIAKYALTAGDPALRDMRTDPQGRRKRVLKERVYNRLPPVLRAAAYFLSRYVLQLGFLDGLRGFIWHFLQGFWYRLLVDVKVMEIEQRSQGDPRRIKEILTSEFGVEV